MMKKISVLLLLMLSVIYGCQTPYQQKGFFTNGYSETRLDHNIFKVTFNGNESTSEERVYDFALLRSAELTLKHGYNYFVIVDSKKNNTFYKKEIPVVNTIKTDSTVTTITGSKTSVEVEPGLVNLIKCYKEKPSGEFSYDASLIQNSIFEKYKLKR